jgi:hypothetical protein
LAVSTGNDFARVIHRIESVRTLASKTVTLSFYAKGTNPSAAGKLGARFQQYFGTGGSPSASIDGPEIDVVLTSEWKRYSFTFTIPSLVGKTIGTNNNDHLAIDIGQLSSTSTNSWTLDLWGVQVEEGPVATPFRRNAPSIQAELAACQRYYQRISGASVTVASGTYYTSTRAYFASTMPEMRVVPLITASAASAVLVFSNSNSAASTSLVFAQTVSSTKTWEFDAITSTRTAGHGAWARINGASNFIEFDAEL